MAAKAPVMAKRTKRAGTSTAKRGKTRKAVVKKAAKRAVSKKAKKPAKRTATGLMKKPRPGITKARRKKKQVPAPVPQIETEIIDVVEEPFPSVLTITEFESERLVVPDSSDEKYKG